MSESMRRIVVVITILIPLITGCSLRPAPVTFPNLHERQITGAGDYNIPVRWSPDGRYLAYQSNDSTNVIICDLTTGWQWNVGQHVPFPDGPIEKFEWHPSGRMSYLKWRYTPRGTSLDGVNELHLVDVDGRNDTIIIDNFPADINYLWFPDGRRLIMRWKAQPSNEPIDDVYIVDSVTGQREALVSHQALNLGIVAMVLLPDEDTLLLSGTRESGNDGASYFILYSLAQRQVSKEILLDPLFASGVLPGYPNFRPHIGSFSLNYVRLGAHRWIVDDFWAPAGECYNYAAFFFDLDDTSRNFCIPSASGPIGDISVSSDAAHIAFTPTNGPWSVWIKVADLTPEIRTQLEH